MKFILLMAAVVTYICFNDFTSRLNTVGRDAEQSLSSGQSQSLQVSLLSSEQAAELVAKLQAYENKQPEIAVVKQPNDAPPTPSVALMSEEEQLRQSGKLKAFYHDADKYTLRATFNDNGERFALLERQELLNSKQHNLVLRVEQQVAGYRVRSINLTSVQLVYQDRLIELELFKNNS